MSDMPDDPAYLQGRAHGWESGYEAAIGKTADLVKKARALVEMLDDAEVNHGGLYSGKTMRAVGELRLELAKWPK
jgi:hypothetical protein